MVNVREFPSANDFLSRAQPYLERYVVANSLILGVCIRLRDHPERFKPENFLATVEDANGLRLAAMMTPPHNLVLSFSDEVDAPAIEQLARHLNGSSWRPPGVLAQVDSARAFAQAWSAVSGASHHLEQQMRLHRLDEVLLSPAADGELRQATEAETTLVSDWWHAFSAEALGEEDRAGAERAAAQHINDGDIFLWWDGRPVSMALRTRPVGQGISIGGVYTPPELRCRGYATACVAELSRRLLASGRHYCSLFTNLANPTSNRIYAQIGYRPVCDVDWIQFE